MVGFRFLLEGKLESGGWDGSEDGGVVSWGWFTVGWVTAVSCSGWEGVWKTFGVGGRVVAV